MRTVRPLSQAYASPAPAGAAADHIPGRGRIVPVLITDRGEVRLPDHIHAVLNLDLTNIRLKMRWIPADKA